MSAFQLSLPLDECTPAAIAALSPAALVAQGDGVQGCTTPPIRTAFVCTVTHPSGTVHRFRFGTRREANACARGYITAKTKVAQAKGYMSNAGWVEV